MSLQYLQAAPAQHTTTTDNAIPLLQLTLKRSQPPPTSYYCFILLILRYQLHQLHLTIYYLPITYYLLLLITTYYLPTTTLSLSFFLIYHQKSSPLYSYLLPTIYLLLFLYCFAPLLPAAILTTHNYYYLPTTPKLYYPSTFFHF